MNADLLTIGKYITAESVDPPLTFTIKDAARDDMDGAKGKEKKGMVSFSETDKRWVLNVTNKDILKSLWGKETKAWNGKRVQLHAVNVRGVDGQPTRGIQICGSPDIDSDKVVRIKHRGKPPEEIKVRLIVKGANKAPPPIPSGEPTADEMRRSDEAAQ